MDADNCSVSVLTTEVEMDADNCSVSVLTTEVEMDADNYAVYQYWQQRWRWMQITMQCIGTGNRGGDGCR